MWNLLEAYKKDRIVCLTTHYMDEADVLGDRVGIMNQGQLTCLGSPMFLKQRFGEGYEMTITKRDEKGSLENIFEFCKGRLGPSISKISELGDEMTVKIPKTLSSSFINFFADFDECMDELDVVNYGVDLTTLEQIFLDIGHLKEPHKAIKHFGDLDVEHFDNERNPAYMDSLREGKQQDTTP
jgi:ATP-binding cassette subfamily A (ABC1) protein 3